jgi:Flp pilus assembly pilin Flp
MSILKALWRAENGQELAEYALLLAFIGLTTAALVISQGASVNSIWVTGNNELTTAASSVS